MAPASTTEELQCTRHFTLFRHRFTPFFILSSVILDLYRFGIKDASDVIIAGCSAGGLAVLLNIDRVTRLLPASARVRALSDAGFFIDAKDHRGAESLCDLFIFF
jgi:hypothetical protein